MCARGGRIQWASSGHNTFRITASSSPEHISEDSSQRPTLHLVFLQQPEIPAARTHLGKATAKPQRSRSARATARAALVIFTWATLQQSKIYSSQKLSSSSLSSLDLILNPKQTDLVFNPVQIRAAKFLTSVATWICKIPPEYWRLLKGTNIKMAPKSVLCKFHLECTNLLFAWIWPGNIFVYITEFGPESEQESPE